MTKRPARRKRAHAKSEIFAHGDKDIQTLLEFERLISELSTTFVNLPPENVDEEIERWLGRVGEFLGMKLCTLAQFSQYGAEVRFSHGWAAKGLMPPSSLRTADSWPWAIDRLKRGHVVQFTNVKDLPDEAKIDKQSFTDVGSISHISIPLSVAGKTIGILSFGSPQTVDSWPHDYVERFTVIGNVFSNALIRKRSEETLQQALSEIRALKEQLEAENVYLRKQIRLRETHEEIVGESDAIKTVLNQVEQVAQTDSTVLIQGETGTGKELVANAIHRLSKRKAANLVKVNCAAIPQTLIESELFGREKGAYTGALSREIGRFEMAHKGTILLDEIGELPVEVQSKLLRVLENGTFERLGSSKSIKVDARVIASTNKDLDSAVQNGSFRPDLYYRLNVFNIHVPPLRHRKGDIPILVWWFVRNYTKKMDKRIDLVPRTTMEAFQKHHWPGNIRELMNIVERSVILSPGPVLQAGALFEQRSTIADVLPMEDMERDYILKVLELTDWRVRGKEGAADLLRLKPTTLESRMKKLGIERRQHPTKYRRT